ECDALVCFLATGATIRLLAPLFGDKHTDPGVVVVDEGRRFAVALLGGHGGGANLLAEQVADTLGAEPVVTTATDARGATALDGIGWPVEGAVARVTRALLDGEPVRLVADAVWPLPPLPVGDVGELVLQVTDRLAPADNATVVLRPPSLVLGVGASRGVSADEVGELIDRTLADAGLSAASVAAVVTVDAKADEQGILDAAAARSWSVTTYPAEQLAAVSVPNPSEAVDAAVGTPSVAEAAALVGGGELVVAKRKSDRTPDQSAPMATVAVVRRPPRGRLAIVGLGPGARDLLTERARTELRRASVVVGLDQYVEQVRDLLRPGTRVLESGLGDEEARARTAVDQAMAGHAVALIGSGDAGVYAMASPALEMLGEQSMADETIDVVGVPGVTAALAASAALGAPLGHDHVAISLSDLHTPWPAIEQRVRAAAEADFVVSFYNPRSRGRDWQLPRAHELLGANRPPDTPIGLVRDVTRPREQVVLTTLAKVDPAAVDMLTTVVVGSSQTRLVGGRMVTPRGYRWAGDAP
ncbi:MAG: cobalt-precorrin hydrolase / cobalt-factor methyltransferase / precorrin-3B, partial [Frankiaceae bacterium]|nr:cobalt-precorrin hydrolase / cobalt-factor methyltransferase / precorrin-3B [Frankiaceae bacterium]